MMSVEKSFSEDMAASKTRKILLLGASVGKAWNLTEWPGRVKNKKYSFESMAIYDFDKSQALEEILMRPKRKFRLTRTYLKGIFEAPLQKPDFIIIKECAGYFPGNFERYKELVKGWVLQCRAAGIKAIVTTVVPVTLEHAKTKPGRLEGIIAYNDWVKVYTKEIGIGCLDLETPLRVSEENRGLREDLTIGDGLHLNTMAYNILDKALLENSDKLFGN